MTIQFFVRSLTILGATLAIPAAHAEDSTPPSTDLAVQAEDLLEFKRQVVGHYAHYDVVAYVDRLPLGEMRTYVITYGISALKLDEAGRLIAEDRFCHASHKANLPFQSEVPDSFTRAIVPRTVEVEVRKSGDQYTLWRPETPTPIGIRLDDRSESLPKNPRDPRISDDDHDGKPGVTVKIKLYGRFNTELYIARREIFAYSLNRQSDGSLAGHVVDRSEQLIVGSPMPFLRSQRSPVQHPDLNLSPISLIPIDESYDCDRLMEDRDHIFPAEPEMF